MRNRVEALQKKMTEELSCSGHSIDHVKRVYHLCCRIAQGEENVDMDVLEAAAMLHDIARERESNDQSGETDHAILGAALSMSILRAHGYPKGQIEQIQHCIETHRFRSGHEPRTIEAKILFDADKLDAIGAVGIARTFMLAGQFGQPILSDDLAARDNKMGNAVTNGRLKDVSKHTPFMEYEVKLKKIPERLYTNTGKQIAEERMSIMDTFFTRLKQEIAGDK